MQNAPWPNSRPSVQSSSPQTKRWRRLRTQNSRSAKVQRPYLPRSTTATLFTPLQARNSCPSGVATIFLTTPPPDGIAFVVNLSDFGSNLTSVFGFTPDSLYQTSPSFVIAIPYGSDSEPPGDNHSLSSFPLDGSKCPRYPRAKSV